MKHQAETQFRYLIIRAGAGSELAGLHIPLALPGTKIDVPASALFNHPFGDAMVFVLVSVIGQLRTVVIPLKVCFYLILDMFQIGIIGSMVSTLEKNNISFFKSFLCS